ncbi:MAG: MBL fold metallo-hydrolase [Ignisphaera sp.]
MVSIRVFILGVISTNTYVIYDEDKNALIVDPGDDSPEIIDWVNKLGLRVKAIVATHGHFDHILGVDYLRNSLGAEFYMHKEDLGISRESMEWMSLWGLNPREAPRPDHLIEETTMEIGSLHVEIIHTPGHTPGSICIYVKNNKIIFSGDTLFYKSVGRTDLPGGSNRELMNSLRKIFTILPAETMVYPGHGPSTTLKHELIANPFVKLVLK